MQESKMPKKPLIYYATIAMAILMLLNAFVFPSLLKAQVIETDYGTFFEKTGCG